MRLKFSIWVTYWPLCLLFVFLLSNCRKNDHLSNSKADQFPDPQGSHFFADFKATDPHTASIKDFVLNQDREYHFSQEYFKVLGTPRWDKVVSFFSKKNALSSRQGNAFDSTISFIPFVKDSQRNIKVTLVVKTIETDTTFQLLYAKDYKVFGFTSANESGQTARDIFYLFATLDESVFGTKKFIIKDKRLLSGAEQADISDLDWSQLKFTYTLEDATSTPVVNTAVIVEYCRTTTYCAEYGLKPFKTMPSVTEVISVDDTDPPCIRWGVSTNCWYEWVQIPQPEDGNSGGGGGWPTPPGGDPGGGGGGGGGGGWTPPTDPDPCDPNAPGGNVGLEDPLCEGWEPQPPPPPADYEITWSNGFPVTGGNIYVKYYNQNDQFWTNVRNIQNQVSSTGSTQPFSSAHLRNLCISRGWNQGVTPLQFSYRVGRAFEQTALYFWNFGENTANWDAPQRSLMNGGTVKKVRPDAFDNFTVQWADANGNMRQGTLDNTFGVEVKAYAGTLELSSNDYQVLGELEVLRRNFDNLVASPYWQQVQPPLTINSVKIGPVLLFVTTEDTEIGQSIITKAQQLGIAIWQSKANIDMYTGKISFSFPKYVYDKSGNYLKGNEVPKSWMQSVLQGGDPNNAPSWLLTPPLGSNFDVDPEKLEP